MSRWEERGSRIRWSFGTRWWSWSGQVGVQSSWRKSLSPRRPRSGNGRYRADRDEGRRSDGLTTPEREELSRLKRELRQVKLEREILAKATAWFARETGSMPSGGSSSSKAHQAEFRLPRLSSAGSLYHSMRGSSEPLRPDRRRTQSWLEEIKKSHKKSDGTYGAPRIHADLILPRVGGHFQTEVKEVSRWEERGSRIRWSFGTRWWSWSGQVGVQSSWRKSLSPRRPRSGNGRIGRTVTRAVEVTV